MRTWQLERLHKHFTVIKKINSGNRVYLRASSIVAGAKAVTIETNKLLYFGMANYKN